MALIPVFALVALLALGILLLGRWAEGAPLCTCDDPECGGGCLRR